MLCTTRSAVAVRAVISWVLRDCTALLRPVWSPVRSWRMTGHSNGLNRDMGKD